MPPAVIDAMTKFRAALDAQEQAQSVRMAAAWREVTQSLDGEFDRLALEVANAASAGQPVRQWHINRLQRYQSLMRQVGEAMREYAPVAGAEVTEAQWIAARQGINHSQQLIAMQLPGVGAQFDRLPVEAVRNMVGLAGDGTPLGRLLRDSFGTLAPDVSGALVRGVALGWHPTRIARAMRDAVNVTLDRAITIARTETARVYRETSRQQYIRSRVVEGYIRVAAKSVRTCMACLMADGTFYPLDVPFEEHVNGRCTSVPQVKGAPPIVYETGAQWFARQDAATQRQMMGPGRYEAWQHGQFQLADLVMRVESDVWGHSLQVRPLRVLLATATPVVQPPAPPVAGPQGIPVSNALTIPPRAPVALREAMTAIDRVHGDGQLDTIPLRLATLRGDEGAYRGTTTKAVEIMINRQAADPRFTLAHEVGHWLDHQQLKIAIGTQTDPVLAAANGRVLAAIRQSQAYRDWQEMAAGRKLLTVVEPDGTRRQMVAPAYYMQYIMEESELWARAYAQYIVERSQEPGLVQEFAGYRTRLSGFDQWDSVDFVPVAEAIDRLMEAMGWRR